MNRSITNSGASSPPVRVSAGTQPPDLRGQDTRILTASSMDPPAGDADAGVDLLEYWHIILKRRWAVLGTLGIIAATALIITFLTPSVFRALTTMQIERDTIQVVQVQGFMPVEPVEDKDFYQTQYELLKSRALAKRVIDKLGLMQDPSFAKAHQPSALSWFIGLFRPHGSDVSDPVVGFLKDVVVEPVRNSRLVRIGFDSRTPEFSARVSNALAEEFITSNLERRMDSTSYAGKYLQDHLQQLKVKLEESEQDLAKFADEQQIINLDDKQNPVAQQLEATGTAVAEARKDRMAAEAKYKQVHGAPVDSLPEVLQSEVIRNLKDRRIDLGATYQQNLQTLKPEFPTMLALSKQIKEIDLQLAAEISRITGSIKSTYDAAAAKESMLQSHLDQLKTQVLDLQNRSIKYNILKRDVDTNRQLYEGLLQRYKEIGVAGGVGANNISIVDRAVPPNKRYSPSLMLNLAVAILLGLVGGILLALLIEHLDDTIKSPDDVERLFGLSLLGIVPRSKMTLLESMEDPRSVMSEAYRSVRTALQFSTDKGVPRTLLVTSASPSEGKSTTVAALGFHFARLGKRVLLVDADLRNPVLHKLFGLDNSAGLSNYLAGAARPFEALRATKNPRLTCLCSGPLPPSPVELLAGSKMLGLLSLAGEKFDQVIIDGPPVMGLADAVVLGSICQGTVMVVEAATRRGYLAGMLRRLMLARARILGVVLTKYDTRVGGYGYGYGYGYGANNQLSYGNAPTSPQLARK